ncbi:2,3-bisphosphoglycerate-dependent phosphoglycerate mutase [Legionella massiliensis]|uniref:phosphoglycerate mutase (2,3-diphosphoglycerate-dependent) n=1 Tax=Legionella massiliensis TaxID=1034943 RepID=A0A078KZH2_9GAMM|nr:histidine phosphatase family protein [Legionella massiliensis]CDZ77189.1 2,3-bisphosphoglycerate-dependent phosphoglycerate mutase [Legionella massiliensis]CEE12927.1 2,3-bisphosphoglycerate-dependent phosphoglycerate mutase [Legionella massiliensis]
MTTRLLIARHGNTFGPGDVVTRVGRTDLPLVESGLQQGHNLGIHLKQHHLIPDVIFASELKRALQTAEQAVKAMQLNISIEALAIFNEIDYGIDENQPEEKVVARLGAEALTAWESNAIIPPGWNVDPQEIIKNWKLFAEELRKEYSGKTILVVTSNGIARFAPYLTGDFAAFRAKHNIKISTGALCVFESSAQTEDWQCLQWNIKPITSNL